MLGVIKRLILGFAIILFCIFLSACGSSAEDPVVTGTLQPNEESGSTTEPELEPTMNSEMGWDYSFSLDSEIVEVFWNDDGSLSLSYEFTFTNDTDAPAIDFVDVIYPSKNVQLDGITAKVDDEEILQIEESTYFPGSIALALNKNAIQPGETGVVTVQMDQITDVLILDPDDNQSVRALFFPTWFGEVFTHGTTDMTVVVHLPSGVQTSEVQLHDLPPGWVGDFINTIDDQGRIIYTINNPNANGYSSYLFEISFPKSHIPEIAIVDQIQLDPMYAVVYNDRGITYGEKGEYDQAIAEFNQAINIDPENADAFNFLGYSYTLMGEYEKSIPYYDQAIVLQPEEASYYNARGNAFANYRDLDNAFNDYSKAIELNPEDVGSYIDRGWIYAGRGDFELGIADLSNAVELDPENIRTYLIRAWIYDDSSDYSSAVEDYDMVIELDPIYAEAYFWQGIGYAVLGESEKAITDFEMALELGLEPEDAEQAQELLIELREFGEIQISYDGTWLGTTEQGEQIEIQIEDNGVQSVLIGFVIPGCEGDSPMSSWFGTPEFFVTNKTLDISLTGLYNIKLKGSFTAPAAISGTLEISESNPCNKGLTATWSAVPAYAFEPPPLSPDLLSVMPDLEIPDNLFDKSAGSDNYHIYQALLGQQGDWYLVQSFDSVVPVPAGWTTFGGVREDIILAYHMEGLLYDGYSGTEGFDKAPEIIIAVGGYWGTDRTIGELIVEAEEAFSQEPNFTIIKTQVIDLKRAYIFFRVDRELEFDFYRIYLFSQLPDGMIRSLDMLADVYVWEEYYPVIRTIAENWISSVDQSALGVTLPETLLE